MSRADSLQKIENFFDKYLPSNVRSFSRTPNFFFMFIAGISCVLIIWYLFWQVPQAQDLMIAYTEGELMQRFYFVAVFYYFVFCIWYSSRLIVHAKVQMGAKVPDFYQTYFPPLMAFICFPIMQAATKQIPYYYDNAFTRLESWLYVGVHVLVFLFLIKFMTRMRSLYRETRLARMVKTISYILSGILLVLSFVWASFSGRINGLFYLFVGLEFAFLAHFMIVLAPSEKLLGEKSFWIAKKFYSISTHLDQNLFSVFNVLSLLAMVLYLYSMISLPFVLSLGTFCFVFLSLGFLAGLYNFIFYLSIRYRISFVFYSLLTVILLSFVFNMPYNVRIQRLKSVNELVYKSQPDLKAYLNSWIELRKNEIDSARKEFPLYFVLSDGGASRSAYWVASVLAQLEEKTEHEFSKNLFCLSGASGGSLGNATFYSLLYLNTANKQKLNYFTASREFLKNDFLSFTLSRMMGTDLYGYFLPIPLNDNDRAAALEKSMEYYKNDSVSKMMGSLFSRFALQSNPGRLPILCINTTRMQDGGPGVVSTISIKNDLKSFNDRIDVLNLLKEGEDINLSTAVVLGARFPYVSPAGNLHGNYFVDGGYFDNSGSGFVQELIRAIKLSATDSINAKRIAKFRYYVIHISNSPSGTVELKNISRLSNDLTAPIQTLAGAYGMQTTINDKRLIQYLSDIEYPADSLPNYFTIPLYREKLDPTDPYYDKRTKKEFPYSMNWYISDTTFRRMRNQIDNCTQLNFLIDQIKTHFRSYKQANKDSLLNSTNIFPVKAP